MYVTGIPPIVLVVDPVSQCVELHADLKQHAIHERSRGHFDTPYVDGGTHLDLSTHNARGHQRQRQHGNDVCVSHVKLMLARTWPPVMGRGADAARATARD